MSDRTDKPAEKPEDGAGDRFQWKRGGHGRIIKRGDVPPPPADYSRAWAETDEPPKPE